TTLSNNSAGNVVTYIPAALLAANSTNALAAIYTDSGGTPTTAPNTSQFTLGPAQLLTVPAADGQPTKAVPPNAYTLRVHHAPATNAGATNGFALRITKAPDNSPDADFPTPIARAEAQLAGQITNANTGQPYPNVANGGPNSDGRYSDTNVINFDINAQSTGT